ncbi:MAG TPA: hypothetical protein PLM79_14495 [Syntrophobacteraceae bacterium]|nr:hypothetical protein [Syntrophobacteraceae bacterium]
MVLKNDFRKASLFVFFALAVMIPLSCSSVSKQKGEQEDLQEIADAFNSAVRWSDFKTACGFVLPPRKQAFWDQMDEMSNTVRIMDFQIREVSVPQKKNRGTVILRYRYYHMDSPNMRTKNLQQHWIFSEQEKSWFVAEHNLQSLMEGKKK